MGSGPKRYQIGKQNMLGETKLIFWSTGKTAKKIGSVGRQNKNI